MRRSLVFALMLSVGHASVAMAGRGPDDADFASWGGKETLLQSGRRIITRQATATPAVAAMTVLETKRLRADVAGRAALQAQGTLAQSGMRTRNKFLIGLGIAAAFAGVALAIDGGVEDSTPSSRGER